MNKFVEMMSIHVPDLNEIHQLAPTIPIFVLHFSHTHSKLKKQNQLNITKITIFYICIDNKENKENDFHLLK